MGEGQVRRRDGAARGTRRGLHRRGRAGDATRLRRTEGHLSHHAAEAEAAAAKAAEVVTAAQDAGYIVNMPGPDLIRLAPPLVLTDDDASAFLAAWPGILDTALGGTP